MAKKSILYIITKSVWGGAAKYVFDLATDLSNEFEVFVAAGGQEKFAQEVIKQKIPYFSISSFQRSINPFKDIFAFFEVLSLLFQLKPNIIHANSPKAGGIVGAAAWFYKLLTSQKPRLIFTAHGWTFAEERPQWQINLIKFFSKLTALFYNKIICVSKYDNQIAIKNKIAPANKLVTIHNGIDLKTIFFLSRKQAQKKLINKTSPFVIGTIAEWTKNKGLIYLLKAVKKIKEDPSTSSGNKFDLILIGSGENPDKEKIQQFIKKNKLKNIHLIEFIDQAASYLKAFDIFVLPSLKEGLPYTILEAMAAQVPIIASQIGGIPEMINNQDSSGILIPSKNSRILAEKILYLINNPKIGQQMAQKARGKIEQEFSLEKMIKKTKKIYN